MLTDVLMQLWTDITAESCYCSQGLGEGQITEGRLLDSRDDKHTGYNWLLLLALYNILVTVELGLSVLVITSSHWTITG